MMRSIVAKIDKNGKVHIEFIGFVGEECSDEREQLRKVMLDFGVMLETEKITKKTIQQISKEIAGSEEEIGITFGR